MLVRMVQGVVVCDDLVGWELGVGMGLFICECVLTVLG